MRDRFGQLPPEVETLFGIARLRATCTRLGITEVSTFRTQARLRPVGIPDRLQLDLQRRVPEAAYHPATKTLNLTPDVMGGPSLPGWVEGRLLAALEEAAVSVWVEPGARTPPHRGRVAGIGRPRPPRRRGELRRRRRHGRVRRPGRRLRGRRGGPAGKRAPRGDVGRSGRPPPGPGGGADRRRGGLGPGARRPRGPSVGGRRTSGAPRPLPSRGLHPDRWEGPVAVEPVGLRGDAQPGPARGRQHDLNKPPPGSASASEATVIVKTPPTVDEAS